MIYAGFSDNMFSIRTRGTVTSWRLTKINYKAYQRCLLARRTVRFYWCAVGRVPLMLTRVTIDA